MEKNQIIELRIEDMLDDGRAFIYGKESDH